MSPNGKAGVIGRAFLARGHLVMGAMVVITAIKADHRCVPSVNWEVRLARQDSPASPP